MGAKFVLVLLLWGIILATEAHYNSDGNNNDAYFELALKWPNSYCKANPASCNGSEPPQKFTISYLRLIQRAQGNEQKNCPSACELSDEIIEKHRDDLLKWWPDLSANGNFDDSKKMWKEQWKTYGSCAYPNLKPEDYLMLALKSIKAFEPRSILKSKGIFPDDRPYPSRRILNVLRNALGSQVDIACEKDGDGNVYFSEVHQCRNYSGTKITDCYNRAKDCEEDPIYADQPDNGNN